MSGLNPPTVELQSKPPHRSVFLVIEHDAGHPPALLMATLEAVGWKSDGLAEAPPLDGREEITVGKRGSGIFGSWTPEERKANLAEIHALLKRLGFANVPYHRLTAAELE